MGSTETRADIGIVAPPSLHLNLFERIATNGLNGTFVGILSKVVCVENVWRALYLKALSATTELLTFHACLLGVGYVAVVLLRYVVCCMYFVGTV